jgi:phosphoglycolate phosphatase
VTKDAGSRIRVVILDMAGTTVADDGVVIQAFHEALADAGVSKRAPESARAEKIVHETMGQSKIEVFRLVLGDEVAAQRANEVFEQAYGDRVRAGLVEPIPDAEFVLASLRRRRIRTCLTTGFSATTRDALLKELGWDGVVDLVLSPSDAGRGRPYPDMLWTAMLALQAASVDEVAVVGDTASDMQAGLRAGIPLRAGVLTGSDDTDRLRSGGATHVVSDVSEILALL